MRSRKRKTGRIQGAPTGEEFGQQGLDGAAEADLADEGRDQEDSQEGRGEDDGGGHAGLLEGREKAPRPTLERSATEPVDGGSQSGELLAIHHVICPILGV
jgi:hypothetical protein